MTAKFPGTAIGARPLATSFGVSLEFIYVYTVYMFLKQKLNQSKNTLS